MSTEPAPSLSEADIKALCLAKLIELRRISRGAVLANEYRLGSSGIRADLAILDRVFVGIEIKSERDSLRRLESQIAAYALYFDLVLLVVAEKHTPNLNIDTSSIELWEVSKLGEIRILSRPLERAQRGTSASLIDLLPIRQRRKLRGQSSSDIANAFKGHFNDQFLETSTAFWNHTQGQIESAYLDILSVYKPLRNKAAELAKRRLESLKGWGAP